jgi:SAM-dependent methyltransferase
VNAPHAPTAVQRHYSSLLGGVYTWMLGDFDARLAEERALLARLGLRGPGRAVDLGCGSGLHTLALADLGFSATGVDLDAGLLAELDARATGRDIATVQRDFVDHLGATPPVDVVACLGDGLACLADRARMAELFAHARRCLLPSGRLVLSFRDQSVELRGVDRFLVARADERRVLTTFLEYEPDRVVVHDLLHARGDDGTWRLRASAYPKLRLCAADVAERVRAAGLHVEYLAVERRVAVLVARPGPSPGPEHGPPRGRFVPCLGNVQFPPLRPPP